MKDSYEIERKFLINKLPDDLESHPYHELAQAYLSGDPVIRIRRSDSDYILTYKAGGLMIRKEVELPLTEKSFTHLLTKADGLVISKRRYVIPTSMETEDGVLDLKIELDVFKGALEGFILAEVEFPSEKTATSYTPPEWLGKEVTDDPLFHNVNLSQLSIDDCKTFLSKYAYRG